MARRSRSRRRLRQRSSRCQACAAARLRGRDGAAWQRPTTTQAVSAYVQLLPVRRVQLDCEDDLSELIAGLHTDMRVRGLLERKYLVDNWPHAGAFVHLEHGREVRRRSHRASKNVQLFPENSADLDALCRAER